MSLMLIVQEYIMFRDQNHRSYLVFSTYDIDVAYQNQHYDFLIISTS